MCVGVYDSPISCFSPYRSLNAIPQCSQSIISWTTHTHLHLMHRRTVACCSFLCTFSGSLCQTGGPLSSLSVCGFLSLPFFLYLPPLVTHTHSAKHVRPHTCKQITHAELLHCHKDLDRYRGGRFGQKNNSMIYLIAIAKL